MPLTVGYARVSTTKQEDAGLSLEAQKRRLIEAGANEVLVDVMSGAKDDRPQFRQLMAMVQERRVDVVLVCKLDRLTRSITARAELYQAFTAPNAPVLKALDDGIDLSTASGRQMFDLLGALATGERERIRERIVDGLNARRELGLYVGQTPWGLRLTRTGCGVEIDPTLKSDVEAALSVFRQEKTITAAATRISQELGRTKSRSIWRTWLGSPQLSGSLPHGAIDRATNRRKYKSLTPGAFTSYLTPVEQEQLLTKFASAKRGPRSHAPEHPTRGRVFCGCCGKPLQRRLDDKKQPRWLTCSNIYCEIGRRSISMPDATESIIRAVFYFGLYDLEKRVVLQQQAQRNRPVHPRESELQATIQALQSMDQSIVGAALDKAEKELVSIRQEHYVAATVSTINTKRVLELMEFSAGRSLAEKDDPATWESLTELVKLLPVSLSTKQHETKTFGGKPVVVVDKAFFTRGTDQEQSISVEDLPPIGQKGGIARFTELAAAYKAMRF